MTAKVTPVSKEKSQGKQAKPKDKKKKTGRYKLILKGTWLKTPADWARFDAWAKVNALPRKIPQSEPISRTSKPLWKMKKRIDILSKPVEKPDSSHLYRPDLGVSKKALKAKASKRLKIIAKPVIKPSPIFREFPVIIKKSTLNYKATENIIKISKPKDYRTDECKILEEYVRKMEDELEGMEEENRKKNEKKLWVTLKRAMACPDLLTPGQINQLITEGGVYRTAFAYEFTPWMEFLSLPSYRFLKLRKDETAEKWREYILSEMETRGRRALEEQIKREEKKRKLEDEAAEEEEKAGNIEQVKKDPSTISKKDEKPPEDQLNEQSQGKTEETKVAEDGQEETEEPGQNIENAEDGDEKTNEEEAPSEEVIQRNEDEDIDDKQESEVPEDQEKLGDGKSVKTVRLDGKPSTKSIKSEKKAKPVRVIPKLSPKEEDEESKKKRAERNAWRFEPPPWKEGDPLKVKKSALEGPVPPRMAELAQPRVHKDTISRKNPFDVRKSALTSPVPARMTELAKPPRPKDPVERPPPREKNQYNQPIFPMPPYGKKMPKRKPYKERECKSSEEPPQEDEKPQEIVRQPDPIIFKPTIDPYFDPNGAERQSKARKAMKDKDEDVKDVSEMDS